jgi:Uma2 family endonuclease
MTTKLKFITADELLRMPRDGNRYELIRGVLVAKMPTGRPHGETVTMTNYVLTGYVIDNDCGSISSGEPGYRLERDPDTVRAPDVAWFAPGRLPEGIQGYPELAPDLAIEVKSPSNSNPEMASKAAMWLSYGSQQVWVEDPERATVTIYRSGAPPPSANTIPLTAATCSQGSPLRCGGCFVGGGRPMR